MNLLETSQQLKVEADLLIAETDVVRDFSSLGSVNYAGSYALDVLFRPDIDLIVISDALDRQLAADLTKKLLENKTYQTVAFADWVERREDNVARGYYWELIVIRGKEKWKFDVWNMLAEDDYSVEPALRFKTILEKDPDLRLPILQLKAHYFDGVKYRDGVTGYDIYSAVLEKGVRTVKDFEKEREDI